MKKFIKNLLLGLIVICAIGVQPVFAADYDLNSSVYNHLENWDTEFEISYYKPDALEVIKDIAKKDDYLWISIKRMLYSRVGNKATVTVTYLTTKEQEESMNKELTGIVNSIITKDMNDFEKIKVINQYIMDRYEYDYSLSSNNVYSALTTGKTICQGYAMTAYKMLNLAGVENNIIIGKLDGIAHGWNLVKLNGKWYHLDVTNDDVANNKYFLQNDNTLRNDGFTWVTNDYPICNETYEEDLTNYEVHSTLNGNLKLVNNITQSISSSKQNGNNYVQPSIGYNSYVDGNWYLRNASWYFLKNVGSYAVGWNIIDNQWYYLGSNGEMQTGWIYYSGRWYYCYPVNGAMAVNTIINGYRVDSTGAWIA